MGDIAEIIAGIIITAVIVVLSFDGVKFMRETDKKNERE